MVKNDTNTSGCVGAVLGTFLHAGKAGLRTGLRHARRRFGSLQQSTIRSSGRATTWRPAGDFTCDWTDHFIRSASKHLGHLVGIPAHVLEIGVFEGRGALWLLENILTHPAARYTGIDPYRQYTVFDRISVDASKVQRRAFANLQTHAEKVELILRPSVGVLPMLPAAHFDAIYIDGDHRLAAALTDGLLAWPLLKPGGIMAWDDLEHDSTPVERAFEAFIGVTPDAVVVERRQQGWLTKRSTTA